MSSIIPAPFSKSKWIDAIYPHIEPSLIYIEEHLGLARTSVIGIPIIMLFVYILYPYFKRKKYDGRFYVLMVYFAVCIVIFGAIQISFMLRK